jgi:hypothetical protein
MRCSVLLLFVGDGVGDEVSRALVSRTELAVSAPLRTARPTTPEITDRAVFAVAIQ